jgi:hypothetical protein
MKNKIIYSIQELLVIDCVLCCVLCVVNKVISPILGSVS